MHPDMLHELARAQINESIAAARRHELARLARAGQPTTPHPRLPFGFTRAARRRRLRLIKA
jgi:hypothetical protein